jgi:hypothetical protein
MISILDKNISTLKDKGLKDDPLFVKSERIYNSIVEKLNVIHKLTSMLENMKAEIPESITNIISLRKINEYKSKLERVKDHLRKIIENVNSINNEVIKMIDSDLNRFIKERMLTMKELISKMKGFIQLSEYEIAELDRILNNIDDLLNYLEISPSNLYEDYAKIYIDAYKTIDKLYNYINNILKEAFPEKEVRKRLVEYIIDKIRTSEKLEISYREVSTNYGIRLDDFMKLLEVLYENDLLRDIRIEI